MYDIETVEDFVRADSARITEGQTLSLRCPRCGRMGSFEKLMNQSNIVVQDAAVGTAVSPDTHCLVVRRCPAPDCHAVIFAVVKADGSLVKSYPPSEMPFDATDIPSDVRDNFEEAIRCHSVGCYRAAAIMIRRTLEVLAADRGAPEGTLAARLTALHDEVILSPQLMEAATELRWFGNDATHVNARDYANVGEQEVQVAIELAAAILGAIYQQHVLVRKLQSFRIPAAE